MRRTLRSTLSSPPWAGLLIVCAALAPTLAATLSMQRDRDGAYGLVSDRPVPPLPDIAEGYRLVMFGYLGCDTVCHTQALELKRLAQSLAQTPVRFVYVSMNPKQDGPHLDAYFSTEQANLTVFLPESQHEAQQLALAYGVPFSRRAGDREQGFIEHPGHLLLVGPDARLRRIYTEGHRDFLTIASEIERLAGTAPS